MKKVLALGMVAVALAIAAASAAAGTNPNTLTLAIFGDSPYYDPAFDPPSPVDEGAAQIARRRIQQDAGVHRRDQRRPDVPRSSTSATSTPASSTAPGRTTRRSSTCGRRSPTRWSTRRATTSGPTATRRPRAAALRRDRQIDYVQDGGNPVDYAGGDPIANLALVRSIFFAEPGRDARQQHDAGHVAGAGLRSRAPEDREYVENVMWEQSRRPVRHDQRAGRLEQRQGRLVRRAERDAGADPGGRRAHGGRPALARPGVRAWRRPTTSHGVVIIEPGRHVGPRRKAAAHQTGYEPFVASIATHTHGVRQAGADAQRRLAHLPIGQPAEAGSSCDGERTSAAYDAWTQPPVLRRAELPPHRGPRQHGPAGVAKADHRSARRMEERLDADLLGSVQLAASDAGAAHAHALAAVLGIVELARRSPSDHNAAAQTTTIALLPVGCVNSMCVKIAAFRLRRSRGPVRRLRRSGLGSGRESAPRRLRRIG